MVTNETPVEKTEIKVSVTESIGIGIDRIVPIVPEFPFPNSTKFHQI